MVLLSCPVCAREVGGYVPKGGDGSAMRSRRHKDPGGVDCVGWFTAVEYWYEATQ